MSTMQTFKHRFDCNGKYIDYGTYKYPCQAEEHNCERCGKPFVSDCSGFYVEGSEGLKYSGGNQDTFDFWICTPCHDELWKFLDPKNKR